MTFWADMLHCNGGRLYTGHTDDLERRIAEHENDDGGGFTSAYRPVRLIWTQEFPTRLEAMEADRQIKGWSRAKKLALARGDSGEVRRLAKGKAGLRQAQPERNADKPAPCRR
jgi:putative endonuclease